VNYSNKKCSHSTECYVTLTELFVFMVCFAIVCIPYDMKVVTCKDNTILVDRRCLYTNISYNRWLKVFSQTTKHILQILLYF